MGCSLYPELPPDFENCNEQKDGLEVYEYKKRKYNAWPRK